MAEAALNDPGAHLYGPVLGDTELREEIAKRWSVAYGAEIDAAALLGQGPADRRNQGRRRAHRDIAFEIGRAAQVGQRTRERNAVRAEPVHFPVSRDQFARHDIKIPDLPARHLGSTAPRDMARRR